MKGFHRHLFVVAAAVCALVAAPAARAEAQACVTSVSPNPLAVPVNGAAFTLTVQTATPTCQWFVGPFPTWLGFPNQFGGTGSGSVTFSSAMPNHDGLARTNPGVLTIGGVNVALSQPANPCPLTTSPTILTIPANGGSGTFTIHTTGSSCSYAVNPDEDVIITAGQSGSTFPATVSFTVAPNPNRDSRARSVTVSSLGTFLFARGIGILQNGPPVVTDAPTTGFRFAVHHSGTGAAHVSPPETLQITNVEDPDAAWTVTVSHGWLRVSSTSGATPETVTLSVDSAAAAALPVGVYVAEAIFLSPVAPITPRALTVSLSVTNAASFTSAPGGVIDTPAPNATGLSGAIAVTGWAIDDVGIARVQIFRDAVGIEVPGIVYIGDATRVRGARPDIVSAFPGRPELSRAGWGFMILSNMLPNGGNGTFVLSAFAEDIEGRRTLIGQRVATFDNTNSAFPFGTIDFPAQGGLMSGTYNNQGWVLAQPGQFIPFNGATIRLLIDGALQPNGASYDNPRPDVAFYFPAPTYANSGGPAAQFTIDTTQFTNGVHTIVWTATDAAGVTQGIGSRYVEIQNPSGSSTGAVEARSAAAVRSIPVATAFVWDRKGFDEGPWDLQFAGTRTNEIRARHGERIEVALDTWLWSKGCGPFSAFLKTGDVAGPLPPGASLDGDHGLFRWMPPAAFAGTFEFSFVRRVCGGGEERIPVKVIIGDR